MKKVFAIGMASLCALGVAGSVSALQMSGNTESIQAEYDVSSAFTVTVPAGIFFSSTNTSINETVSASNLLINDGEILNVSMESTNGQLQNTSASYIPYSFKIGEEATTIAAATDYALLSVDAGNKSGDSTAVTFIAGDLNNVTLAGMHSDTLTFKVSVASAPAKLVDSRDGKEYTIAEIAGKTWMTENLKFVPEGATWKKDGIYADNATGEVYYTWDAAQTACPNGWKLPTEEDFRALANLYDRDTIMSGPFNGVRAGSVWLDEPDDIGDMGGYWSSISLNGEYAIYLLIYDFDPVAGTGSRDAGYSVRCIAK